MVQSCLFLGTGGAGGPGAELCEQAVDRAALLAAASLLHLRTKLGAAAPPVIIIILEPPVKKSKQGEFLLPDV